MLVVVWEHDSVDKINKKETVIIWSWLNISADSSKKSQFSHNCRIVFVFIRLYGLIFPQQKFLAKFLLQLCYIFTG